MGLRSLSLRNPRSVLYDKDRRSIDRPHSVHESQELARWMPGAGHLRGSLLPQRPRRDSMTDLSPLQSPMHMVRVEWMVRGRGCIVRVPGIAYQGSLVSLQHFEGCVVTSSRCDRIDGRGQVLVDPRPSVLTVDVQARLIRGHRACVLHIGVSGPSETNRRERRGRSRG